MTIYSLRKQLEAAEKMLGVLAMQILQEQRPELLEWAQSVRLSFADGTPRVITSEPTE